MEKKYRAAITGATGMVGQKILVRLVGNPILDVAYLAASPESAGKTYEKAVQGKWQMPIDIPQGIANLVVHDASDVQNAINQCDFVFSAVELNDKEATKKLEMEYAKAGIPVVSNDSAHRWTPDVPMIIPEINHDHLKIIEAQKAHYGFDKGFIVVKPNCSIQSYMLPVHALMRAGYDVRAISVVTLQATSGAGQKGPIAYRMIDNMVPYISGEEDKTRKEPKKIFGSIQDGRIVNLDSLKISADCNRGNLIDGHTAWVGLCFGDKKPAGLDEIIHLWDTYSSLPQELNLPSAPKQPIIYRREVDRPQPRIDRDSGDGMSVTVGRLRADEDGIFDIKFTGLSHNTVRGAGGGGILTAELLAKLRYFG